MKTRAAEHIAFVARILAIVGLALLGLRLPVAGQTLAPSKENDQILQEKAALPNSFGRETGRTTPPGAREGIGAMIRRFEQAFAKGDLETIMDEYANDAQSFLQNHDPISGRAAIRDEMVKFLSASKGARISVQTMDVQQAGNWAYETEKIEMTLPNGNVVDSKWLLVRKFEDGKWRIYREAGNFNPSNAPTNLEPNYKQWATRIVNSLARVKPGEMVVIAGGKHTTALMEELAIQASIAGGLPQILLDSDRIQRALVTEVPEDYLEQSPTYLKAWVEHTDVVIGLASLEDPQAVFHDAKPERLAKIAKADQVFHDAWRNSKIRYVNVAYPTPGQAADVHLDFPSLQTAVWEAMSADYQSIAKAGNRLSQILQSGNIVRLTSPSGTALTFKLGHRPVMVEDGILTPEKARSRYALMRGASLPGGSVWVAPLETSAEGTVVIPRDQFQSIHIRGESFRFRKGHLEDYKADQNAQALPLYLAPHTGPKETFGFFQIGLNPNARVIENPGDFRPSYVAGLVTIGIGDNELRGGKNRVDGGAAVNFPIVNATVTVDDKIVVQDGKLCF